MIVLALLLVEPDRQKLQASPWKGVSDVVARFATTPALRRASGLSAILQASGVIGVWFYILYFQACGLRIALFGVLLAAFGVCCGLGARLSAPLATRIDVRAVFWAVALLILGKDIFPRKEKRLPVVLTRGEVAQLLDLIEQPVYRTALSTICSCGLRLSEDLRAKRTTSTATGW